MQDAYILLEGIRGGLKLKGKTNDDGIPVTLLVRENPCNDQALPTLLFTHDSQRLTLENLRFDNSRYYYSAGKVVQKSDDHFEDIPAERQIFVDAFSENVSIFNNTSSS